MNRIIFVRVLDAAKEHLLVQFWRKDGSHCSYWLPKIRGSRIHRLIEPICDAKLHLSLYNSLCIDYKPKDSDYAIYSISHRKSDRNFYAEDYVGAYDESDAHTTVLQFLSREGVVWYVGEGIFKTESHDGFRNTFRIDLVQ